MLNSSTRFGAVGFVHVQNVRVPLHALRVYGCASAVQRSAGGESARLS